MILEDLGSADDCVDYRPPKYPFSRNLPLKLATGESEEGHGVTGTGETVDQAAER